MKPGLYEQKAESLAIKLISGDMTPDEIFDSLSDAERRHPVFKNLMDALTCTDPTPAHDAVGRQDAE